MNQPNLHHRLMDKTISAFTLCIAFCCLFNTVYAYKQMPYSVSVATQSYTSKHTASADRNYELGTANDTCTTELVVEHSSVLCLNPSSINNLKQPAFKSECSELVKLDKEEEYIDFNCNAAGFNGYFQLSRWQLQTIYGDGGVDVTGAPNVTLVEGANKALVKTAAGSKTTLKIVIPANGIATFDWSNFGGSKFFYSILLNGKSYPINKNNLNKGSFRTPILRIGDLLEIQMEASEQTDEVEISNFNFYSNAIGLLQRHWKALDSNNKEYLKTQLIAIEKANITDVIFPANRDDFEAPALDLATDYSPEITGYPLIDRDGDLNSVHDQYLLKNEDCTFRVEWIDEWSNEDHTFLLNRRWIIEDVCSDNRMEETQIIKLNNVPASKIAPGYLPGNSLPASKTTEGRKTSTTLSSMQGGLNGIVDSLGRNYEQMKLHSSFDQLADPSNYGIETRFRSGLPYPFTTRYPLSRNNDYTVVAFFNIHHNQHKENKALFFY